MRSMEPARQNVFSIDLEDWFCVHNLSGVINLTDHLACVETDAAFRRDGLG